MYASTDILHINGCPVIVLLALPLCQDNALQIIFLGRRLQSFSDCGIVGAVVEQMNTHFNTDGWRR